MKTFREYLQEAEYFEDRPGIGDYFDLEIARDETLIETFVVDVVEDGIVLEADDTVLQILRQAGYLNENSNLPPAEDSTSPINGRKDARRYNFETSPDNDLEEQQAGPVTTGYSGSGRSPDMQMAVDMAKMDAKRQALTKIHGPEFQDKEMPPHTFGKLDIQPDGKGGYKVSAPLTINQQNEADTSSDPYSMDDTEAWANKIRTTVPKTRIDTSKWTDVDWYSHDKKTGKFQGPGGFDEWKLNRANRTRPQPGTPSNTVPTNEAKYRGRTVPLGKKMAGDVKKSKVYVRKPNGNIVKVEFGDPNMRIKKSNPKRRKSFRARHNCDNPGPRWKARYWSCRSW